MYRMSGVQEVCTLGFVVTFLIGEENRIAYFQKMNSSKDSV